MKFVFGNYISSIFFEADINALMHRIVKMLRLIPVKNVDFSMDAGVTKRQKVHWILDFGYLLTLQIVIKRGKIVQVLM